MPGENAVNAGRDEHKSLAGWLGWLVGWLVGIEGENLYLIATRGGEFL